MCAKFELGQQVYRIGYRIGILAVKEFTISGIRTTRDHRGVKHEYTAEGIFYDGGDDFYTTRAKASKGLRCYLEKGVKDAERDLVKAKAALEAALKR